MIEVPLKITVHAKLTYSGPREAELAQLLHTGATFSCNLMGAGEYCYLECCNEGVVTVKYDVLTDLVQPVAGFRIDQRELEFLIEEALKAPRENQ